MNSKKTELIKKFEYDTKLMALRIKYSKSIWETISLALGGVMNTVQLKTQLAQPIPKFEKGGLAIIGEGRLPEVIERI